MFYGEGRDVLSVSIQQGSVLRLGTGGNGLTCREQMGFKAQREETGPGGPGIEEK